MAVLRPSDILYEFAQFFAKRCENLILILNRLDGPVELLTQSLGEELLDRDLELVGEDDSETRVDIVLGWPC